MKTLTKTVLIVVIAGLGAFAHVSQAAPIVGSIDFGGVVTFDTMSLATATRINVWNSAFVLQTFGDFSGISQFTSVSMSPNWIFNTGTPGLPSPGPTTAPLWTVGGFSFDLTSCVVLVQTPTFLNISGPGTVSGNGFDPTPGTWTFTSSNSNGSNSNQFSFQASTVVPEASSLYLLATGGLVCAGMRFLGRKRAMAEGK